jgi:hypothetical protein
VNIDWQATWKFVGELDWAAIAQVVATIVLVVALVTTERRASRDATRADAAAERAENAARGTIDALGQIARSIDAIEVSGSPAEARPRGVEWQMTHHMGDTYLLKNVGGRTAESVTVSSHPSLRIVDGTVQGGPNLGPGEALTFMASRTMGTRDSTITVHWINPGNGEEREWKYPLPARPPR